MMTVENSRPVLVYDGECPLCRKAAAWVREKSGPDEFEFLTCQSEERARRFPDVPAERCMEAIQLALPDGAIYAGDQALPFLFERMRGWRWLARILRVPLVCTLAPLAYALVARNRYMISILVAQKHKDSSNACALDGDCTEKEDAGRLGPP